MKDEVEIKLAERRHLEGGSRQSTSNSATFGFQPRRISLSALDTTGIMDRRRPQLNMSDFPPPPVASIGRFLPTIDLLPGEAIASVLDMIWL